jgi:hypothetical protein
MFKLVKSPKNVHSCAIVKKIKIKMTNRVSCMEMNINLKHEYKPVPISIIAEKRIFFWKYKANIIDTFLLKHVNKCQAMFI